MRITLLSLALACGCANASMKADGGQGSGAKGHTGNGFVAGGVVGTSAHYKLIGTLSSGQGTASSAHYAQHGGVVGTTQP